MTNTTILVRTKQVYGKPMLYPANAQAENLCMLVGAKTLSPRHLDIALAMGFTITEAPTVSAWQAKS